MQIQKNKNEEVQNCGICDLPIEADDHYCVLHNFNKGDKTSVGYYHAKCFRDKFLKSNQISKSLDKSNKLLDKAMRRFLE